MNKIICPDCGKPMFWGNHSGHIPFGVENVTTARRRNMTLIMTLALAMRLFWLGRAPLWYDESFTAWVSSLPLGQMLSALAGDVHPPGYYLMTWAAVHLSGAVTPHQLAIALRLVSVLFSLGSVPLVYAVGRTLRWPDRANWAATLFMAVAPFQVFYAQEARMYAALQFLMLLAFWGILTRRWWLVSLGLTAGLWVHNYALFYWVTFLPVVLWVVLDLEITLSPFNGLRGIVSIETKNLKALIAPGIAFGIPLIAWLPWVRMLLDQMSTVAGGYWIMDPTLGDVLADIYYLLGGVNQYAAFYPVSVMCVMGALAITTIRIAQQRPHGWLPLLALGWLPLIGALLASWIWQPVLLYRGLIGSAPALYLLVAWALTRGNKTYHLIALTLIVPLVISGLTNHYVDNPKGRDVSEMDQLVAAYQDEFRQGDIIYHLDSGSMVAYWLYLRDLPQYKAPLPPGCEAETMGSLSPATRQSLGIIEKPLDEIAHERVFFVWAIGPTIHECTVNYYRPLRDSGTRWEAYTGRDDKFVETGIWILDE